MAEIRDFREQDREVLSGFKAMWVCNDFPGCSFDRGMYENLIMKSSREFPGTVRVAVSGGEVAGYIWFKALQSTVGNFGRVEDIYVSEAHRGQGIGKMLMQDAERYFHGRGIRRVKLTVTKGNERALSLYRSLGYSLTRFRMEKDL